MIHYHTYALLNKHYLRGKHSLLLLGDQIMNLNESIQGMPAAGYLNAVDIDINGKAMITEDLSKSLSKTRLESIGTFDIIADFGTIEHINNLVNALKNVLNLAKVGGKMIHCNPKIGHFPGHKRQDSKDCHKFTMDFWERYAKATKCELIETSEQAAYYNTKTGVEVYAVLKKTEDSKPLSAKAFESLLKYVFTE